MVPGIPLPDKTQHGWDSRELVIRRSWSACWAAPQHPGACASTASCCSATCWRARSLQTPGDSSQRLRGFCMRHICQTLQCQRHCAGSRCVAATADPPRADARLTSSVQPDQSLQAVSYVVTGCVVAPGRVTRRNLSLLRASPGRWQRTACCVTSCSACAARTPQCVFYRIGIQGLWSAEKHWMLVQACSGSIPHSEPGNLLLLW